MQGFEGCCREQGLRHCRVPFTCNAMYVVWQCLHRPSLLRQLLSVFFFAVRFQLLRGFQLGFEGGRVSAIRLHLVTRPYIHSIPCLYECGSNVFYVFHFFFAVALQTHCLLSILCFARCGCVCLLLCICFCIFTFHIVFRCSLQVEKQSLEGNPPLPLSCSIR